MVRSVAQLGSALDWGSRGRRFESGRSDHPPLRRDQAAGKITSAPTALFAAIFAILTIFAMFALPGLVRADAPRTSPDTEGPAIDAFFGTFHGKAKVGTGAKAVNRDLSVTIAPGPDRGFVVNWTTIVRDQDGKDASKSYSIAFQPTQRRGIYRSAMRSNVFGQRVPLDPFTGEPLVWARVAGRTMTVFALIILIDGGYDMQVYDRTLSDAGLDLVFTRWIDRDQVAKIEASLVRAHE